MFFFIPNTKEKGTAHHLRHVFRKGLLGPSLISASVSSVGPYFWNENWGYPASDQLSSQLLVQGWRERSLEGQWEGEAQPPLTCCILRISDSEDIHVPPL